MHNWKFVLFDQRSISPTITSCPWQPRFLAQIPHCGMWNMFSVVVSRYFLFLFCFLLWFTGSLGIYRLISKYLWFSNFPPVINFEFHTSIVRKKIFSIISVFNLLRFVLWPNIWSILENVLCMLEKSKYSVANDRMFYICLLGPFGLWYSSSPMFPY